MNNRQNTSDTQFNFFELPCAPTFYPTVDEFRDPWKYIRSIRDTLARTGIAVVQPPKDGLWDFDTFRIFDKKKFQFTTKAQNVHQMQHRTGPNVQFLIKLREFWSIRGKHLDYLPEINGQILDLMGLKNEVESRGGVETVDKNNLWGEIMLKLHIIDELETNVNSYAQMVRWEFMELIQPFIEENKKDTQKHSRLIMKYEKPAKRAKLDPQAIAEPMWSQVKSRSFAKDANDALQCKIIAMGMKSNLNTRNMTTGELESISADFGYGMGKQYTIDEYEEMAKKFEKIWGNCDTLYKKEMQYWNLIENGDKFVQVQYGSDLDVKFHGSGFPIKDSLSTNNTTPVNEYMKNSGWNTNNLASSTFLHHINESVAGLTRPMLYIGMLFSSFCWHVEDNYLYSINYVHTGNPKLWYGVPGTAADAFEKAMRDYLPELFDKHPNLLHLLVTQLSPRILRQAGVPVYTAIQKPGQFIITSPRSYHAGFNSGFNLAESVNFTIEDWLPFCRKACDDYRFQRSAVFPYEEFVLKAARQPDNLQIAELLKVEILNIICKEQNLQTKLLKDGIKQYITVRAEGYHSCHSCGYDCYLSGVVCHSHPDVISCLNHANLLCSCPLKEKILVVRSHLVELKKILDSLPEK